MKLSFSLMKFTGLGLIAVICASGCNDRVLDMGVAHAQQKNTTVVDDQPMDSAKVGRRLTAANFGNAEFADSILKNDKPVIVDFSATWCGPCQILKPILHELEKDGLAHVVMIDTDQHPEIATSFGIQGIPHLLFVKDGMLLDTSTGLQRKEELISTIEDLTP